MKRWIVVWREGSTMKTSAKWFDSYELAAIVFGSIPFARKWILELAVED